MRARGQHVWGFPNLKPHELERVRESNVLTMNTIALMEGVSLRGGGHLLEHPADPGEPPYPSIWSTDEVIGFQERTCSVPRLMHQCMCGAPARKATFLSTDLDGSDNLEILCDGRHRHTFKRGVEGGVFATRALQEYPPAMCARIADCIIATLVRLRDSGSGPTGWIRSELPARRLSAWSSRCTGDRDLGVSFLNEFGPRGQSAVVSGRQAAFYLHVDDGISLTDGKSDTRAEVISKRCVKALEDAGFVIGSQETVSNWGIWLCTS